MNHIAICYILMSYLLSYSKLIVIKWYTDIWIWSAEILQSETANFGNHRFNSSHHTTSSSLSASTACSDGVACEDGSEFDVHLLQTQKG